MKTVFAPRFGVLAAGVVASAGFSMLPTTAAVAEELGIIQVESTTIDDRFENKRGEPSNIGVIKGEEVDAAHTENVYQLLRSVPGLTTEFDSGDTLKIHIRGVENQRFMGEKPGVAVVIDGVPVFERTGKVNIDLDNIESIKVVKGGASYLFGEDALGGAVIITTKRGADMAGVKVAGEVGSFGYNKGVVRAGTAKENYAAHVQVSRREADGYYFQSDYQTDYANGKLQYYLDDVSDITFGFEVSDRAKDSHGSVTGVTQAEEDPQSYEGRDYARMFDVALNKMFVTYSRDVSEKSNLKVNVYQFTDQTNFVSRPQDYDASGTPVTDVDAYINGNDYDQVQQGVKGEWRTGGEKVAWMAGVDLRENSYENYNKYITDFKTSPFSPAVYTAGTVTDDNRTEEAVRAVYGEMKFRPLKDWTFTLNGRYDDIGLDYTDNLNDLELDKSFRVVSWRAGANYALSGRTDLYTNASTGFRTPTVDQLFAGDISPFGDTESNPDLEPEQSLNLEVGLRGKATLGSVPVDYDVALFQLEREDYIMATTGHYSAPETGTQRYENIGGTRSRGLELTLNTDPTRTFSADVAYTFLDAVYTEYDQYNLVYGSAWSPTGFETFYDLSGNRVPRVPKHHLNLSLNTRVSDEMKFSVETDTISDYYADDLNQLKIGGHTEVNFLANYNKRLQSGSTLELFARIDNVLDRYYFNTARTTGDRNEDGVYDDEDMSIVVNQGRTFTVGMSMTF